MFPGVMFGVGLDVWVFCSTHIGRGELLHELADLDPDNKRTSISNSHCCPEDYGPVNGRNACPLKCHHWHSLTSLSLFWS